MILWYCVIFTDESSTCTVHSETDLQKKSIFILNPIPGQEVAVEKFRKFLTAIFHYPIYPSYQSDVATNVTKLHSWIDHGIGTGGFVLVICTNFMRRGERTLTQQFQPGLHMISEYIKEHSLKARQINRLLIAIRFDEAAVDIPTELSGATQFVMPHDLDELQRHIHDEVNVTARKKYSRYPEWIEFSRHLDDMAREKQFRSRFDNHRQHWSSVHSHHFGSDGDTSSQTMAALQSQ